MSKNETEILTFLFKNSNEYTMHMHKLHSYENNFSKTNYLLMGQKMALLDFWGKVYF